MKKTWKCMLVALLCCTGCDMEALRKEAATEARYKNGEVQIVATAPDGTVLYRAWDNLKDQDVYFSRAGAQWRTSTTDSEGSTRYKSHQVSGSK